MNKSTKPPIAVTKEQREKFRRRFKKNMPKTFSGVIFHVADAFEKFIKRGDTEVDMSQWHAVRNYRGDGSLCVACLAGAAMIDLCGATGFESLEDAGKEDGHAEIGAFHRLFLSKKMGHYEEMVNAVRGGNMSWACSRFYRHFQGSVVYDEYCYASNRLNEIGKGFWKAEEEGYPEFIGCLRRAAKKVKALGL